MPDLPSGTVTFLFTDIEGSTRLLQHLGDSYADLLSAHRTLLRSAFEAHAGHEVDTQGDAFFYAFSRAGDAVAGAVAAQQALSAYSWPVGSEVKVRMGLHTGEPLRTESGYVGLDVHRGSRLMSAGHGGQVLLSQTTWNLIEDELPAGVHLRDLGEHRLRDLIRPLRIAQLEIDGLPAEFPPLKTLDSRPHNLSVQPANLIGREQELATAHELLQRESVRLLTLTGAGGSGKTRLALQIAAEELSEYDDGVFFVPLAPVSDAALVLQTIAHTLGIKESGEESFGQALQRFLHDKQMLLVLDNFEQVIEAAPQVAELLSGCPHLKILVTSREALRVRGEQELPVPPLAVPSLKSPLLPVETLTQYAAVELFIQRAKAVKLDFTVTNENAPAVAEICSRLDGLPLAIELAAARIKLLPPEALLTRLETRLKILTGGARDLPARHQTLRAAIGWSYDLLLEPEKILFRRLAVFVGGCTIEAVERVCCSGSSEGEASEGETSKSNFAEDNSAEGESSLDSLGLDTPNLDALEGIASLLDKSLLRQEEQNGETRYFMLETVREYALERLKESNEQDELQRRHTAYFLEIAEAYENTYNTPEFSRTLDRIEAEHDNMRAALAWSKAAPQGTETALRMTGALRMFWDIHGYWSEARSHFADVLSLDVLSLEIGRELSALRLSALQMAGWMATQQGDIKAARALYQEALALAEENNDLYGKTEALLYLAWSLDKGQSAEKKALLEERLAISKELEDRTMIAYALYELGRFFLVEGDLETARSYYAQAQGVATEFSDQHLIGYIFNGLAQMALSERKHAEARSYFEQHLSLQEELHAEEGMAFTLLDLGRLAEIEKDLAKAQEYYERSLSILEPMGHKRSIVDTYDSLGDIARLEGNFEQADSCYERSFLLSQELGHAERIARALRKLQRSARLRGDSDLVRSLLEKGIRLYQEMEAAGHGSTDGLLGNLSAMAVEEGDYLRAKQWGLEFLNSMRAAGDTVGIVIRLLFMAQVGRAQGNVQEGRTYLQEALTLYANMEKHEQERWQYAVLETGGMLIVAEVQIDEGQLDKEQLGEEQLEQEHLDRAVRLLAVADKEWNTLIQQLGENAVVSVWRAEFERYVEMARNTLGDDAFAIVWAAGQEMAAPEAIRYALEYIMPE